MDIDLRGAVDGRVKDIFIDDAVSFVASLHREFNAERLRLLDKRYERQAELDAGAHSTFSQAPRKSGRVTGRLDHFRPTSRTDASR